MAKAIAIPDDGLAIAHSRPFVLSSATRNLPSPRPLPTTRRCFVSAARSSFCPWTSRNDCHRLLLQPVDGAVRVKFGAFGQLGGRSFAAGAANVIGGGSFDLSLIESMEKKIKEQLNADLVSVKDAYGDGRHVSIDVVASAFEGQSAVNRQRMVYKAIWDELQNIVHAVDAMTTKTPDEAA